MAAPSLLQTLTKRHDLWWQFTVRAVEMRHRGSYLGVLWTVLNPLLMLAMYVIVFGLIIRSSFHALPNETPVDYTLAVFTGLILFHITAETIAASPTYIVASPNLVKKVVFPLEVLPLANTSALWFHFTVSFALLLIACLVTGRSPSLIGLLWMPLILIPNLFFTIGISWFLSAFGVFFRDISQLVGVIIQIAMYASAVMIPVHIMADGVPRLWQILKWNPLLQSIELSRRALLWKQPIGATELVYTWVVGIVVLLAGAWFFKKLQPAFADVL